MRKTVLYRLFGIGKIPATYAAPLASEGVVLSDEGVRGSVTYLNFRSPGKYAKWERQWYSAAVILTRVRLLAFRHKNQIIDIPLSDERFRQLQFSLEDDNNLLATFDASLFHADWSGMIEYRFQTALARNFFEALQKASG